MHRLRTVLLAGALAIAVITGASLTGTLEALEHDSADMRFSLREDRPPDDIAVVAVDDVTFSDLKKQWPFPRSYFAEVADRLHEAGAREIVFDVQSRNRRRRTRTGRCTRPSTAPAVPSSRRARAAAAAATTSSAARRTCARSARPPPRRTSPTRTRG